MVKPCENCNGFGYVRSGTHSRFYDCPDCGGTGNAPVPPEELGTMQEDKVAYLRRTGELHPDHVDEYYA